MTDRAFFVVSWTGFGIGTALLFARYYTCLAIIRQVRGDLYMATVGFVFASASMATLTLGAIHGMGEKESSIPPEKIEMMILYGWICQMLILISIGLGRIAIVMFLLRIQGHQELFKAILLWFIAGSNLIINIVTAILIIFQCSPVQKLWDDRIPGRCPGREWSQKFGYFQGSWSCFSDLAFAVYPIFIFWRVQAFSIGTRIGLCALMGVGVIAAACAAIKSAKLTLLTNLSDVSYSLSQLALWHELEMWAVFIVGSIPPTKPFFMTIYQKIATAIDFAKKTFNPTLQEPLAESCGSRFRPIEEAPDRLFESTEIAEVGNIPYAVSAQPESQVGE